MNLTVKFNDLIFRAAMAIKSSGLGPLIDLLNHIGSNAQTSPMSSPKYQRFVKALTAIGTYCPVEAERREYFTRILGPISTRFQTLVGLIRSGGDKHRDDVRQELISILNGFIGVALSSQSKSATELFATLSIVAKECGTILSTYNNYNEIVDLCLEFITQIGKHSLSYLPKVSFPVFCHVHLRLKLIMILVLLICRLNPIAFMNVQ